MLLPLLCILAASCFTARQPNQIFFLASWEVSLQALRWIQCARVLKGWLGQKRVSKRNPLLLPLPQRLSPCMKNCSSFWTLPFLNSFVCKAHLSLFRVHFPPSDLLLLSPLSVPRCLHIVTLPGWVIILLNTPRMGFFLSRAAYFSAKWCL